jgi:hypothetical protein
MSAKLIELTELEKCFSMAARPDTHVQLEAVTPPKKKKIRECADLRFWWDNECDTDCAQLESAG